MQTTTTKQTTTTYQKANYYLPASSSGIDAEIPPPLQDGNELPLDEGDTGSTGVQACRPLGASLQKQSQFMKTMKRKGDNNISEL